MPKICCVLLSECDRNTWACYRVYILSYTVRACLSASSNHAAQLQLQIN